MSGFFLRNADPVLPDDLAREALGCPELLHRHAHGTAAGFGAQNFRFATSLRMSMASSFSASSLLSRAFSYFQLLGPLGCLGVLLGPVLVQPPVPGRLGDLEFLDDLAYRAAVVEHFLALPDFGDDLLGGVSACHDP
jgi:hypothetical protein